MAWLPEFTMEEKDLGAWILKNGAWLLDSKNQEGIWRLNMLGLLLGFMVLLLVLDIWSIITRLFLPPWFPHYRCLLKESMI